MPVKENRYNCNNCTKWCKGGEPDCSLRVPIGAQMVMTERKTRGFIAVMNMLNLAVKETADGNFQIVGR